MKLTIDTTERLLTVEQGESTDRVPLYSRRAFELLSHEWLKLGWNQKYTYTFSWLGRPIIQLPDDMLRMQEVLFRVQPDVIVETGIAHGGSLVYAASLCQLIGKGRVIGVDVEIRPHNRQAIERHFLFPRITLIEGDSAAPDVVERVKQLIRPGETVLVNLDSNHDRAHVAKELEAYAPLVSPGSYIVAMDGFRRDLTDVPRGKAEWADDHPTAAAEDFVRAHPEFAIEQPAWPFNESDLAENVTHWPGAWLKRL